MIRWLSEVWVSRSLDRGNAAPRLWHWTFGRFESHRRFASELRQLDGQLQRQATSQQRAIARQSYPIGDYPPRESANDAISGAERAGLLTGRVPVRGKPVLSGLGLCTALVLAAWFIWPAPPPPLDPELPAKFERSFAKVWDPITEQAQATESALRDQTTYIARLPERLPRIDRVVNNLGIAVETPIREEMKRFADDVTRPWTYFASQLSIPVRERRPEPQQVEG